VDIDFISAAMLFTSGMKMGGGLMILGVGLGAGVVMGASAVSSSSELYSSSSSLFSSFESSAKELFLSLESFLRFASAAALVLGLLSSMVVPLAVLFFISLQKVL